ncbi:MAG: xanthine dehydrogenase family protein molybdopterin-binding subunit [Dehalococcoidia bacterium]|nr:xanthine dehydrogenase family protein molybdopterin-binding subunit [Dehalococcoidia bacterium]
MTTIERPQYRTVGTRPVRHDGVDKVTGRARYGNDVNVPGHIYGKILRSPHAHARIRSIDTSAAEALPGVRAVVTGAEMPMAAGKPIPTSEGIFNPFFLSANVLAHQKVLYRGHAVAAVAADTAHIAEEALKSIVVDYEVLPAVLDGTEAMESSAPQVLDDELLVRHTSPFARGGAMTAINEMIHGPNVASAFVMDAGDVAAGFESADVILEHEYTIGAAHQGYIEPQSATASWSQDGHLTIWCSSQGHFMIRDLVATMLGLSSGEVTVVQAEIGGGFGAKLTPTVEPVAALLSRKCGKPVKVAITRTDVFEAVGPTSASRIRLKMGFTDDGKITAAEARLVFEAGAFPGSPVNGAANCMFSPYDIPNARVAGFDVLVNKPKVTAYRAPGAPAGAMAVETMIDEYCEKHGIDPVDFRLDNAAKVGTRRVNGTAATPVGIVEVLEAAKASEHYQSRLPGPNAGRGIAAGFWGNNSGPASAVANVLPDGRVSLVEGSPDIGGTRTVAAMQFAEALEIPVEDVRPSIGDTDSIGFTSLTGGSSVAFKTGWASYEAALDVKRQMTERAATLWGIKPEDVQYSAGVFRNARDEGQQITFKQLAGRLIEAGGPVVGRGSATSRGYAAAYAVHIADVEVDPDTGKVQVLRYTTVQDVGTAIHPSYVEGQMQGGACQGIGWALNEEYVYDRDGRMTNSSFLDYRMPTALDVPAIDTVLVETGNPGHPYGVRGVGEVPIVPPLAALANAVHGATGVRMTTLPMTPTRVLEALEGGQP